MANEKYPCGLPINETNCTVEANCLNISFAEEQTAKKLEEDKQLLRDARMKAFEAGDTEEFDRLGKEGAKLYGSF